MERFAALDVHQGTRPAGFQQCADDEDARTIANVTDLLMGLEHVLDVRSLEPPEPFERVLDALDHLGSGDRLKVLIDRRPVPLFRALERNGFGYREASGQDSLLEIEIWRKE